MIGRHRGSPGAKARLEWVGSVAVGSGIPRGRGPLLAWRAGDGIG